MRSTILIVFFVCSLAAIGCAQGVELYDEFGRIPCGDFMARMDAIWSRTKGNPESRVYVVYFGGRFRREILKQGDRGRTEVIQLVRPHRQDSLNWAKAIPDYLSSYHAYAADYRASIKQRVVLIDGGYREADSVEIWIGIEPPIQRPSLIDPANLTFRHDKKARRTPQYVRCYKDC